MNISVEISMHPLSENYLERVDAFIKNLQNYPHLKVVVSPLSTQVFGDSSQIFSALEKEITQAFTEGQAPFVLKVLKDDLSNMDLSAY
ncbi:MAG: hypothetical protein DA405_07015 [Bacteroidetes bacterium]|nr:MAG: hypothetical protein DA405_07015 [Bacteroidota bacterium]